MYIPLIEPTKIGVGLMAGSMVLVSFQFMQAYYQGGKSFRQALPDGWVWTPFFVGCGLLILGIEVKERREAFEYQRVHPYGIAVGEYPLLAADIRENEILVKFGTQDGAVFRSIGLPALTLVEGAKAKPTLRVEESRITILAPETFIKVSP